VEGTTVEVTKRRFRNGEPLDVRVRGYSAEDKNGCWIWRRDTNTREGHGRITYEGARMMAHRASFLAFVGPIPPGLQVLHRCDVPACVNPDHLFLGTQLDNMRDCAAKGRYNPLRGVNNPSARLTLAKVSVIRRRRDEGASISELARNADVSRATVRSILAGETWR
jgi:HNH endonuclease